MPDPNRFSAFALSLLLVIVSAACGGDTARQEEPVEEIEFAEPPPTVEQTPPAQEGVVLTPTDLDTYERGMRAGIARLDQAAEEMRAARTGTDTLQAMGVVVGSTLDQHMAQSAGVPVDRFREIRNTVDQVLGKRQMGGMQAQMREQMDTTNVPPEQRATMRENLRQMEAAWGDPYAGLTPQTAEALRARADELDRLRADFLAALAQLAR